MYLPIEKIIILKSVEIFSETSDEVLADVASILEEEEYVAGQNIFEEGDLGTCLYIVVRGSVRIHKGEVAIATLKERQIFGELAAIDPEPRSASVTAEEETTLFRLSQSGLIELIADRYEVSEGIM
ncbi:MAG: cyclic nucleotide-binding domain-containing protein, partial [Planctomycetota bacterium]|nr:cyclic nucleotide-binding domain-containing protein [Planctomycetota bacterium]